ncbi:site-2 protease family protein [candidate division KSB1 bacterium]|nr:site-2 protease family protein [candidate division KSB1 bacterium]NIR69831.1 site-2 protease family protein [candidate division KSB1 bacterium]NIS24378.1 site-2 protease family protein [candidate division KSB1 bacterium]NIT71314.1 site-2 protease family protein [candidate division KSB1 bacterium]NIU27609.1 site-2 protease family protein [candidate division KSB1 bacterium]
MDEKSPYLDEYYQQYYTKKRYRIFDKLRSDNPKLNIILFLSTCLTTFMTGWFQNGYWQAGLWYGGAIISILLAHEMGHYLMCRKYGIRATLPFFIPFPIPFGNPFGTMGAVIKMESRIPSRKALFDVAVAGPLAGLVVTIPCIYYGVQFSQVIEIGSRTAENTIFLGESFLYAQISKLAIGTLPENQDVLVHPLAFAGWAGLFVTALNLLPIGQLDGGHVVYALLGRRHKIVATSALVAFAFICVFIYLGWALLLLLIIWFGYHHPPTMDETPIDKKRFAIGILTLIIFLLSFTPEPFKMQIQ